MAKTMSKTFSTDKRDRRPDHHDGRHDLRHLDLEKDLQRVRAIDDGGFDGFFRDAAQSGGEDHHGEPGLDPDQDDHQEEVVVKWKGQPVLRFAIGQIGSGDCRIAPSASDRNTIQAAKTDDRNAAILEKQSATARPVILDIM